MIVFRGAVGDEADIAAYDSVDQEVSFGADNGFLLKAGVTDEGNFDALFVEHAVGRGAEPHDGVAGG